ncbi:MAG: hypothetical protein HRT73_00330 [Flavobacteriales bacterium]|nr:hypothetical protein [Flavobacteriales bacterium]NQX96315.1 hypothetical protein [Flavobacteriales bacterium]
MKKVVLIILLFAFGQALIAQGTVFEEKRTIYKTEQSFGIIIHTRGWGLTYRYGKYTSGFSRRIYDVELVGMKHPKQIKSFSSNFDNSNGYVFGQLNSILVLRASIGNHKTFISKQSVRGIAISSVTNIGLTFAYTKPVYLEVFKVDPVDFELSSEIEKYDPKLHPQQDIIGKASWFRGFFGGKFYPGVYLKGGLNFESSRNASKINSLEVGGVIDLYFQKIPIMANDFNKPYFVNLYVSVTFGSKKTASDIGKTN